MSERNKGLIVIAILYSAAFCFGMAAFLQIEDLFMAEASLTIIATLVIWAASVFWKDTSLYDPYWSVAPPVMLFAAMVRYNLWNMNALLMLLAVTLWSARLTGNWLVTYKGLGREDWRYAQYREKLTPFSYEFLNLAGFQMMPTIVVYAGLTAGLHVIRMPDFHRMVLPGILVMMAGTLLEYTADTAVHRFLKEHAEQRITCRDSVWKYSRHPNYLGEIIFWFGMFLSYVGLYPRVWYKGTGFLLIVTVFLFASIPMMEKHNLERRLDYEEYQKETSVLLLLPSKKDES